VLDSSWPGTSVLFALVRPADHGHDSGCPVGAAIAERRQIAEVSAGVVLGVAPLPIASRLIQRFLVRGFDLWRDQVRSIETTTIDRPIEARRLKAGVQSALNDF